MEMFRVMLTRLIHINFARLRAAVEREEVERKQANVNYLKSSAF